MVSGPDAVQTVLRAVFLDRPDDTTVRLHCTHLAYLKAVVPGNAEIYSKVKNEKIFSNISFKAVTDYVPFASRKTDTLIVRPAGVTTQDLAQGVVSFADKRFYKLVFRGRFNKTATAACPRTLTAFPNY